MGTMEQTLLEKWVTAATERDGQPVSEEDIKSCTNEIATFIVVHLDESDKLEKKFGDWSVVDIRRFAGWTAEQVLGMDEEVVQVIRDYSSEVSQICKIKKLYDDSDSVGFLCYL